MFRIFHVSFWVEGVANTHCTNRPSHMLWLLYSFDTHDRQPSIQMKYNLQNVGMAGRKKKTCTFFCVPPSISGYMRALPWTRECSFHKKLSGPRTNVCKGEHSARQKTLRRLRVALEGSVACHCAAFTVPIWLLTVPAWVQLCTKWRTSIHLPPPPIYAFTNIRTEKTDILFWIPFAGDKLYVVTW